MTKLEKLSSFVLNNEGEIKGSRSYSIKYSGSTTYIGGDPIDYVADDGEIPPEHM